MNINIALLHLCILASQTFYMYLSNKGQMKKHRYLYIIAAPIAAVLPVLLNSQDPWACSLYEYAIIFCIIIAAVIDVTLAAARDKDYMTDETGRTLTYSYFMICAAAAFMGSTTAAVRTVTVFLLVGSFLVFSLKKKTSAVELVRGIPMAALSVLCSWAFVQFGM